MRARHNSTAGEPKTHSPEQTVTIPAGGVLLEASFALPPEPRGIVVFAHGSGSGRWSPRNRHVAAVLRSEGLGTLLPNLTTPEEFAAEENWFDIPVLAARLHSIGLWLETIPEAHGLPVGIFGANIGAAAAFRAACHPRSPYRAVVCRGGRPDLAGDAIIALGMPVLLIAAGLDELNAHINQEADLRINAPHDLVVVEGATHLFEEPGALDRVARAAADWFEHHLPAPVGAPSGRG